MLLIFFYFFSLFSLGSEQKTIIAIQPLGSVNRNIIKIVREGILGIYDVRVEVLSSKGLPCVVSTYRLKRGRATKKKFFNRLVKVVNHELGHTFGLGHCPIRNCLMEDAKGTIKTVDRETGKLCNLCKDKLSYLNIL